MGARPRLRLVPVSMDGIKDGIKDGIGQGRPSGNPLFPSTPGTIFFLEKDQYSHGFDSQTGEYGNLVAKGIIDPTKVVRVAIQNAASVAALLITTEAMVAEVPKKNAGGGMPPGGGGMGGMGGMDF